MGKKFQILFQYKNGQGEWVTRNCVAESVKDCLKTHNIDPDQFGDYRVLMVDEITSEEHIDDKGVKKCH